MTTIVFILFAAAAALLAGCSREETWEEMSPAERLVKLRAQTDLVVRQECTNEIPGVHAIISAEPDDLSDSISAWRCRAVIDYVNKSGGIERTNLDLIFNSTSDGRLTCYPDFALYSRRDQEAFSNHLARIKAGRE